MGIRQCGKTYITRQFAEENYKHVVYINFFKQEELKTAFYGSKDADTIILNLSAQMRSAKFVPSETCIILDEIHVWQRKSWVSSQEYNILQELVATSLFVSSRVC
jgi:predicted AAA+ superfamily ATPase